ncbi:MAG: GntR family transcriptional regulator [Gammaproteobacteria bacterium]|nr:MAG: GntR family transcriptional regulator [Gammaproteobacteria bacterium]
MLTDINLRIAPNAVQQQIIEKLRHAIFSGVFKPGEKLVEAELCNLLGVSRPSVREALRSLQAEKLISIIPNKGPHISILTWEEATEIYKVRALLEGEAAAIAAERATEKDIKAMRILLEAFGKAVRRVDPVEEVGSTTEFYKHIFCLCGNRIIEEMINGLLARINFLRESSMSLPGRSAISFDEMNAILDAIEKKDNEAARFAAVHHVEQARLAAYESFKQSQLR